MTERRKCSTSSGRSHMSPTERSVGLAGQLKRCGTEWQASAHSGHSGCVMPSIRWAEIKGRKRDCRVCLMLRGPEVKVG